MPSFQSFVTKAFVLLSIVLPASYGHALTPPRRIQTIELNSTASIAHSVAGRTKQATDLGQAPLDQRLVGE